MGGVIKYTPNSDTKPHFSIFRTKRTTALTYCSAFLFISFTIFLAFSPSSNSSSPWFTNIFSISSTSTSSTTTSSIFSDQSYRSHFSSIYYYFFPNSSSVGSQNSHKAGVLNPNNSTDLSKGSSNFKNRTQNNTQSDGKGGVLKQNQTDTANFGSKVGVLKENRSTIGVETANKTVNSSSKHTSGLKNNATADGQKVIVENGVVKNLTLSLMKKQSNGSNVAKRGIDDLIKSMKSCNLFDGNWVRDESYPLYKPDSCSLIDEQFNCFRNGRPDNGYLKLKWKPKGCTLPRLDGSTMLELLRGKRLVFVGDSLNRNMWESLICILRNSVKDQKKVYEEFGRHKFRTEASYSFVFEDYKCTVEFFVSPFLVQEWETADKNGTKKETLRLDLLGSFADKYKNADIIVFNTGHWWTHDKTAKGKDYYQEGSHVYSDLNVLEAFRKALTTWGRWVDANVNLAKSFVFFRGYSASHFSGGQWNSGGQCDHETEPIKNETYLSHYPSKMTVLERVLRGMKTRVSYLNVTRMTDYRKDGHPSIYRTQHMSDEERRSPLSFQDCSHWCLPGVPDAWNEILYALLLLKLNQKQ